MDALKNQGSQMSQPNQTAIKAPENKQTIINSHEKASEHHAQAAKLHSEAAMHHKNDHYEKGYAAAHVAAGHSFHAEKEANKACDSACGNDSQKQ